MMTLQQLADIVDRYHRLGLWLVGALLVGYLFIQDLGTPSYSTVALGLALSAMVAMVIFELVNLRGPTSGKEDL